MLLPSAEYLGERTKGGNFESDEITMLESSLRVRAQQRGHSSPWPASRGGKLSAAEVMERSLWLTRLSSQLLSSAFHCLAALGP